MKKGLTSLMCASALLGASSFAFAGAYGEAEQPEEMPAPAPAPAAAYVEPESDAPIMRVFSGFATDAETARGVWVEMNSMYSDVDELDADAVTTMTRVAYGMEMFEVGAELPFVWADTDLFGGDDDIELGNLNFYGKVIPVRTDVFSLGGGLVIGAPTGDSLFDTHAIINPVSNEGASEDEWGFTPFVTGAVAVGTASLRANIGYQVFTDDDNRLADDFDNLPYNIAGLVPLADNVVLRGEIVGRHFFDLNVNEDPVSFLPGVDITIPLDGLDLIIRPTGQVGINDAADWGLGLGLALAQSAS